MLPKNYLHRFIQNESTKTPRNMFRIAIVKPSHAVNVRTNIVLDRFLAFSSSLSSICSAAPIFRKMKVSARVAIPESYSQSFFTVSAKL